MLEYIQIYPETREAVRRYPAADRALLYEAMLDYATSGREPDWPEDDLKWFVWESLRQKVSDAERAHKKKQAAGRAGGQSTGKQSEAEASTTKQSEAEASKAKQDEAEESKAKPESESEPETEAEAEREIDTHTDPPQGSNRRARAGWFDPARPGEADDGAWRYSEPARKAVAQRIITHVRERLQLWDQTRYTEAGSVGSELFGAITTALREGIAPGEIVEMARGCIATWVWELAIKEAVISQAGTDNFPDWTAQLEELCDEAEEIRHPRAAAYG